MLLFHYFIHLPHIDQPTPITLPQYIDTTNLTELRIGNIINAHAAPATELITTLSLPPFPSTLQFCLHKQNKPPHNPLEENKNISCFKHNRKSNDRHERRLNKTW